MNIEPKYGRAPLREAVITVTDTELAMLRHAVRNATADPSRWTTAGARTLSAMLRSLEEVALIK